MTRMFSLYLRVLRALPMRRVREGRGRRYSRLSAVRGRLYAGRLDESGHNLRIGRRFFVSHLPGSRTVVGNHVTLYDDIRLNLDCPGAEITIGDRTYVNRNVQIFCCERVSIGAGCAIGCDVVMVDGGRHGEPARPITVEDDVWIANGVRVMSGVTISRGASIAAGAVVTRDVPPGELFAGVPARSKGARGFRAISELAAGVDQWGTH